MSTYRVKLTLLNGTEAEVDVYDAEDAWSACFAAQNQAVTRSHAVLVAETCAICLDSGIELQPSFDSETNATRRVLCQCEHGTALLADRGPDNFTTKVDPEAARETVMELDQESAS